MTCICPQGWASGGERDPRCPIHHGQPVIRTLLGESKQVAPDDRVAALTDLVQSLHLYIGRHTEEQLTTEQKELLYDVVEAGYREHGISDEPMERWWRAA